MRRFSVSKKEIEDLYINQKLSLRKVAKKLGTSDSTIRRRMKEFGIKSRSISEACKGENHPMYGKHHSEEFKVRMSRAKKGENNPMYGKYGEEHSKWKGGKKMVYLRMRYKRRRLGFRPLNGHFKGSEAHHLQDKETVIYIPKKLHRRISHNNWTGKGMNTIDALALYYLELQMLGETKDLTNLKEVV
jgi:hypothetical protein